MKNGIKKKNIRDVEIGDNVKQTVATGHCENDISDL